MDEKGRQVLQERLVSLLMYSQSVQKTRLAKQIIEMISIMARRYVQKTWPTLFPQLLEQLNNQDLGRYRATFECIKKICKKYRYMNRSDDLYREMLYVIETVSEHLVGTLRMCVSAVEQMQTPSEPEIKNLYMTMNAILHIIESLLGQEELPDFYEEQLPTIMEVCRFIVEKDFVTLPKELVEVTKAKGKVASVLYLYNFKFAEHFDDHKELAFRLIWSFVEQNRLPSDKSGVKLVKKIMDFLQDAASTYERKDFIKKNLIKIFQNVVMPSIAVTDED